MPEPLSIAAGVVGLISSLTALSLNLNQMRRSFVAAEAEINAFLHELRDLTTLLQRLHRSELLLRLPDNMSQDFLGVLKNCGSTAEEVDIMLTKASIKRFRGASWVLSGKNDFLRLCRGLEAHKATLGVTLNFTSAYGVGRIVNT